jgi:hypothetical protein
VEPGEFVHSPYRRPDTAPTASMAATAVRRPAVVVTAQVQEMSSAGARLSGSPRRRAYSSMATSWCVDPTLHLGAGTEVPMRVTLNAISYSDVIQIKHSHFSVGR